jgi:hypothetical protein
MSEQEKPEDIAADERPIPSKAEGPAEENCGERPRPSQAEGDEETIEEDLESQR